MLSGIEVLDFSRLLPGPLATQQMRAFGAKITRIERKSSPDMTRFWPPLVDGVSAIFSLLNEGKEIVELDLAADRAQVETLVRASDILIEQFRPGAMKAWGLDYETLRHINPRLVYISITGFGQKGQHRQRAGHDLNFIAEAGILDALRDEAGRPVIPNFQMADIAGGAQHALTAAFAGLYRRQQTGVGGFFDINMRATVAPLMTIAAAQLSAGVGPQNVRLLNGGQVNYNVYRCRDGAYLTLAALEIKFWHRFCDAVERPEWKRDVLADLAVDIFPRADVEALFLTRGRGRLDRAF